MKRREGTGKEVAEIMRKYLPGYKRKYKLSYEQHEAVTAIMKCRTAEMGGVAVSCDHCGHVEIMYRSCKNRHCPKCGAYEKAQWLEEQKVWVLPIQYFHVVFTIDHEFNWLVWYNQERMYNLLIEVAARLLKRYGEEYLGGEIGFTMVLHSWGQTMQPHLHLHFMVSGGALVKEGEGYRWQAAKGDFLFPVKKLSKEFREAFCRGVGKLWEKGELETVQGALDVGGMMARGQAKDWEVYIQAPPCGVENLLEYLGRYIYRIAMSNHRIVEVGEGKVSFAYYDNRDEGKLKEMTLSGEEFIHRFLLHVLPRRFVRIRHFGLHHASCRKKLKEARRLLGLAMELPLIAKLDLIEWLKSVLKTDTDPRMCPKCGQGLMRPVREFGPLRGWRKSILPVVKGILRWSLPAT